MDLQEQVEVVGSVGFLQVLMEMEEAYQVVLALDMAVQEAEYLTVEGRAAPAVSAQGQVLYKEVLVVILVEGSVEVEMDTGREMGRINMQVVVVAVILEAQEEAT